MTTHLDNQPNELLADLLGTLDVEAKALVKRIEQIKDELKARKIETVEGEMFRVTRSETVRWTLDTKAVAEEMGEAWVTQRSRVTPVTALRITVRKDALLAA